MSTKEEKEAYEALVSLIVYHARGDIEFPGVVGNYNEEISKLSNKVFGTMYAVETLEQFFIICKILRFSAEDTVSCIFSDRRPNERKYQRVLKFLTIHEPLYPIKKPICFSDYKKNVNQIMRNYIVGFSED